jgi:dTDP-L-rhamnose 4-epimerase
LRVLVTGGSGFIGSHVVELLACSGAEVRAVDIAEPGWELDRGVDFRRGDIRDPAVVGAAVDGVDAVCHQAAMVGLGVDFGDTPGYVSTNDLGTALLLEALWRRSFQGRFVLASSMVVYGEGLSRCPEHGAVHPGPRGLSQLQAGRFEPDCPVPGCDATLGWEPIGEDCSPDPRNVYAATKLHQEQLCAAWGRESGASVVSLRYQNVYGPRMPQDTPYAGVASIFCSALAAGRPPQVFEDGGQTRDFVHVDDVARANVIALGAPRSAAGVYNIASGAPRTVGDLAERLAATFGPDAPAPQVTGAWRLGDVRHVVASPCRAAERLGFVAETSLEDGLAAFARTLTGGI